jgi:hypothetical protein
VVPTLPNPDEPPARVADELAPPPLAEPRVPEDLPEEPKLGPQKEAEEELPPADRRSAFDFAWPDHRKEDIPPSDLPPEPEAVAPAPEPDLEPEPSTPAGPQPVEHPRDVAVLKSGVVDGMGYTLYVDGSIEAELPQGTLRFASINELRQHLEQNT